MSKLAIVLILLAIGCASPTSRQESPRQSTPRLVSAADKMAPNRPLDLAALPWRKKPTLEQLRWADYHLQRDRPQEALSILKGVSPPADLLRARAWRLAGELQRAESALTNAANDTVLVAHVALERGLVAAAREDHATVVAALLPLVRGDDVSVARRAALPLLDALRVVDPQALIDHASSIEKVLPPEDMDARSEWLEAQAQALDAVERVDEAAAMQLRRYLEEPVSLETPASLPKGVHATATQLLARAEVLLEAHRNEHVLEVAKEIVTSNLSPDERCQLFFTRGLAARKLRRYSQAEFNLTKAAKECKDEELVRRAMYLQAKVISIRSGLRAVPVIEEFAKRFADHTMVDDVLFWAGDLYQRRKRFEEASRFYDRIVALPEKGDHCAEASWRNAWMAYRRGDLDDASERLSTISSDTICTPERFERARATYWLGRIAERKKDKPRSARRFEEARRIDPLGYYGQLALGRLDRLEQRRWAAPPDERSKRPDLCPGILIEQKGFTRGIELMVRGLMSDAADELRAVELPEQQVMASSHATSLGVEARPASGRQAADVDTCGADAPHLLLALLLDEAGAHREAHWRLRTEFGELLAREPDDATAALWSVAYPLAFRDHIEAAETESGLPVFFLQALAREESALDPKVVSWAGAYGLTQLLLSSGQRAGKMLDPPVALERAEELLDPRLNARLGAALLGSQIRELGGNLALALAAYNAGDDVALTWWKRHQGDAFDVFAEEMTIKETRGYVKRVLKTYGIYRWLYAGEAPVLPIAPIVPRR